MDYFRLAGNSPIASCVSFRGLDSWFKGVGEAQVAPRTGAKNPRRLRACFELMRCWRANRPRSGKPRSSIASYNLHPSLLAPVLLFFGISDQFPVNFTRVIISLAGIGQFPRRDFRRFLRPALVHRCQAPLRAGSQRTHGLAVHNHKNRIRVRRRQNPCRDPTASLNGNVKFQIAHLRIGHDLFSCRRFPIHYNLHRHFPRISDPGAFNVPVGSL